MAYDIPMCMRAYAKINLTLDILNKRSDGYHDIRTIMQTIELHDIVGIQLDDSERVHIYCDNPNVPCDTRNIVYQVAKKMINMAKVYKGCQIHIKKNIPMQAGLGGGSADAAVVIMMLDKLLEFNMPEEQLLKYAAQFGADVPYLIYRGTALCEGIGDEIVRMPQIKSHYVVIAKPNFGISTAEAYKQFDESGGYSHNHSARFVHDFLNRRPFYDSIGNDFFRASTDARLWNVYNALLGEGAEAVSMTGSGSAFFGLYRDGKKAELAYSMLKSTHPDYEMFLTKTYDCPPFL